MAIDTKETSNKVSTYLRERLAQLGYPATFLVEPLDPRRPYLTWLGRFEDVTAIASRLLAEPLRAAAIQAFSKAVMAIEPVIVNQAIGYTVVVAVYDNGAFLTDEEQEATLALRRAVSADIEAVREQLAREVDLIVAGECLKRTLVVKGTLHAGMEIEVLGRGESELSIALGEMELKLPSQEMVRAAQQRLEEQWQTQAPKGVRHWVMWGAPEVLAAHDAECEGCIYAARCGYQSNTQTKAA